MRVQLQPLPDRRWWNCPPADAERTTPGDRRLATRVRRTRGRSSSDQKAAPALVMAAEEGEGPVAALLRDGLDAEAAAPPSVMSAVNTSWDASAERAALRDNLNAYLTREAAAYSGKENQWKNTQGEKSELAATQAKLLREAEELRRREELALVAKRERDAREQDRKRATDEREAALGALSQTLESHFTRLGDDEAKAARRQEELRARSDEAATPSAADTYAEMPLKTGNAMGKAFPTIHSSP